MIQVRLFSKWTILLSSVMLPSWRPKMEITVKMTLVFTPMFCSLLMTRNVGKPGECYHNMKFNRYCLILITVSQVKLRRHFKIVFESNAQVHCVQVVEIFNTCTNLNYCNLCLMSIGDTFQIPPKL